MMVHTIPDTEVHKLYLKAKQLKLSQMHIYSALIIHYARSGRPEKLLVILNMMKVEHYQPNSKVIISVLYSCADYGQMNVAKKVHVLTKLGMNPSLDVYQLLLMGYSRQGTIEALRECLALNEEIKKLGVELND